MPTRILTLHVRREYFDEIRAGRKYYEYRVATPYWTKRLSREYDEVHILLGYPPAAATDRRLRFHWRMPYLDTMIPFWIPGATEPADCFLIRVCQWDRL